MDLTLSVGTLMSILGFPSGTSGKEPTSKCKTRVHSLGLEDALEEGMATHSSILAWRILWTEEPGALQSIGSQRVGCNWSDLTHMHTYQLVCVMDNERGNEIYTWDIVTLTKEQIRMAIHNAMHQNLLRRCSLRDKVLELKPNFKSKFCFLFFVFFLPLLNLWDPVSLLVKW